MTTERHRMIFEVDLVTQMAIKLRAIKLGVTTGDVVEMAVRGMWPEDVKQAEMELTERSKR